METKKVLKKMKSEVGNVLSTVANKAEFVARISKLKLEIAQKNVKFNSCLKDIGEYVYNRKKEFIQDTYIAHMLKEIDEIKQSIEDVKAKIEDIKLLQKEKHVVHGESNKDTIEE